MFPSDILFSFVLSKTLLLHGVHNLTPGLIKLESVFIYLLKSYTMSASMSSSFFNGSLMVSKFITENYLGKMVF
jgi:hypothetical protein